MEDQDAGPLDAAAPEGAELKRIEDEEIETRFRYHTPKDDQPSRYSALRERARDMAYDILRFCPESREKALAFTKLEEAVMWANAAIARRE